MFPKNTYVITQEILPQRQILPQYCYTVQTWNDFKGPLHLCYKWGSVYSLQRFLLSLWRLLCRVFAGYGNCLLMLAKTTLMMSKTLLCCIMGNLSFRISGDWPISHDILASSKSISRNCILKVVFLWLLNQCKSAKLNCLITTLIVQSMNKVKGNGEIRTRSK